MLTGNFYFFNHLRIQYPAGGSPVFAIWQKPDRNAYGSLRLKSNTALVG
jgi:hypothetical protein